MTVATSRHIPIELPKEFLDELMPVAPIAPRRTSTGPTRVSMSALALEVLDGAFMLLRRLSGRKGSKILPAA